MARIALLPTGRMEWHGLGPALARLFPAHKFLALPSQDEIDTQLDGEYPLPGFADNLLTTNRENENAKKLVSRAAQAITKDRHCPAADQVVILDDLELANLHQPQVVVEVMRASVKHYLDQLPSHLRAATAQALQQRVSFHLARPMIESWIFADCRGPQRAGAPHPGLVKPGDPEAFETDDPAYLTDVGCAGYQHRLRTRGKVDKKHTPLWLRGKTSPRRHQHPKAYLAWLCSDPAETTCTRYRETHEGVTALEALDWNALLAHPDHAPFARALIHDIADALGEDRPFPGRCAPETSAPPTVLRNL